MARALAIREVSLAADARAAYLARVAERAASARACAHHLWVFERDDAADEFVEFIETRDAGALGTALAQDALLEESLDFRHAPAARATPWRRYAGIVDS